MGFWISLGETSLQETQCTCHENRAHWISMPCRSGGVDADRVFRWASALNARSREVIAGALLVSHWTVASKASVVLITRMVEALRRSMLVLINDVHPFFRAAFEVVGEGHEAGRPIQDTR